ncbi:MAG: hypothetical protein HRU80_05695 [Ignavibacteriales bacterium]|nr:MAG: hypothetical protein HRU80_05695 [Ignavibacteriales bacterium]
MPPYTSWETACDSIQKCVDFANPGDTIFVEKGEYLESVVSYKRIHLMGAGADSTIVKKDVPGGGVIEIRGGGTIDGFFIQNTTSAQYVGIWVISPLTDTVFIRNCIVVSNSANIMLHKGIVIAEGNYGNGGSFFNGQAVGSGSELHILNNISNSTDDAAPWGIKLTMHGNIINCEEDALYLVNGGPHLITNNIFVTTTNRFGNDNSIAGHKIISRNNLMTAIYFRGAAIWCNYDNDHRNNIVLNAKYGIRPSPDAPSVLSYNAFWKVGQIFENPHVDSTNKFLFPMFVDEEAGDFRLQKYSPLIDAGDPDILDVDGTRSDIGPLGGPYGRSYEYLDLAPRAPFIALPVMTADSLTLRWQKNYETDLTGYRLYQDTVEQFVPFPDKLIYTGKENNYTLARPDSGRNYYCIVTAIDSIVNESKPSQAIQLLLTSADENESELTTPEKTQLLGNYPNPFNPSTTIRYSLQERSYVKLYIYTLRGELLEVRVNEEQSPGEYNYQFSPEITGTIDDLASGVYFYMLETKGRETGKISRETGKMLLMK